jgi:hypothetical protein
VLLQRHLSITVVAIYILHSLLALSNLLDGWIRNFGGHLMAIEADRLLGLDLLYLLLLVFALLLTALVLEVVIILLIIEIIT